MDRSEKAAILDLTARVGRELVRLQLPDQSKRARVYYAAVRDGRAPPGWTHEMIVEWAQLLRLPPHENDLRVLTRQATCPDCSSAKVYTEAVWPGGAKHACDACHATWLELRMELPA